MRRLTRTAFLGLTLLAAISSALAAGPKLSVMPRFGASLTMEGDLPVVVAVDNPAEGRAFTGRVVLQQGSRQWSAPVTLPAGGARASVNLCITTDRWLNGSATEVSLQERSGVPVARLTWNPPVKPQEVLRVLVVNSEGGLSPQWEAWDGQIRNVCRSQRHLVAAGPRRKPGEPYKQDRLPDSDYLSIVPATPQQLTDRASDLDQFGVIVLEGKALALPSEVRAALRNWVNNGGALLSEESTTVTSYGAGKLAPLTVDWSQLTTSTNLVGKLRAQERSENYFDYNPNSGLFSGLLRTSDVQAPPFSTIVLFLGTYLLVIVPVQYLVLRKLDKREWAWGTTPLLAGAFALVAYTVGSQGRSQGAFYNSAAIIETQAGATTGAAVARYGLYSPTRTTYSLAAPTADTTFFLTDGDINGASILQEAGKPVRLEEFSVPQWAMRSVSLHVRDLPLGGGVQAEVTRRTDGLSATVTNNTPVALENVALRVGGRYARLGTLAVGETRRIEMNQRYTGYRDNDSQFGERGFYGILATAASNYLVPGDNWQEATLTAYTAQELVPLGLEGGKATPRTTNSLLVVHVPVK